MKSNRLLQMEEFIRLRQQASLEELCNQFGRSLPTIRRDVAEITRDSRFRKVYGGVRYVKSGGNPLISFQDRNEKLMEEKGRICVAAAASIHDGDVIFIDSGTTTAGLVAHLDEIEKVTLLTNNMYVAFQCMDKTNINLIVLGGQLNLATASLSANFCNLDNLEQFNISKAFMAATGVSIEKGATHTSAGEMDIKKRVVEKCDTCYLLADHSKFGQSALLTYAPLDRFHHVITDQPPPEDYVKYFAKNGVAMNVAE